MKLIQQQSIPGQPPEKKIRVTGGFNNGSDASNYDYQVNSQIFSFNFNLFSIYFLEKFLSTTILVCFVSI